MPWLSIPPFSIVLQFPPLRFFRHFPVLQIPVTLDKDILDNVDVKKLTQEFA